jgi:myo-inositol 2-dehydrogenase / D-chiro-inositol 1-dehydrogenase
MNHSKTPSRRDFLKNNTHLAAGMALLGGLNVARSAHAAANDEMKIALVGCGGRGAGAVVNCLDTVPNVKVIALADAFTDRANGCADMLRKKYGAKVDLPADRVFAGLDAYQKAIAAGPDVVFLATPPGFRPAHYATAVKAGKHVFMEKPCCIDAPGYRSLAETNKVADDKNLKVVVGLQRRHQAGYLQGVREIHDGKLGNIQTMLVYWNGLGGGGRDLGKRPQDDPKEMEFQIRNWGCFLWLYGDNIVEQHVHNIDIANWVMAKDGDTKKAHPIEANGMGGRVNRGNFGDLFDHHCVEFTYADGAKVISQSRHIDATWNCIAEHAIGNKGRRDVAVGGGPKLESGNPYEQEHIDLFKAIRNDVRLNEGWHAAVSSMTGVLGRMATYSGQIVKWDDAVAKGPSEMPETLAWTAKPPHMPGPDGFYPFPIPGVYRAY